MLNVVAISPLYGQESPGSNPGRVMLAYASRVTQNAERRAQSAERRAQNAERRTHGRVARVGGGGRVVFYCKRRSERLILVRRRLPGVSRFQVLAGQLQTSGGQNSSCTPERAGSRAAGPFILTYARVRSAKRAARGARVRVCGAARAALAAERPGAPRTFRSLCTTSVK